MNKKLYIKKNIHRKEVTMQNTEVKILAIIYIGLGSSWIEGIDENKTALECAKMCKMDWEHFKELIMCLYFWCQTFLPIIFMVEKGVHTF